MKILFRYVSLVNKETLLSKILGIYLGLSILVLPVSAQWVKKSNGLDGGDIRALAVSGSNLFAGTLGGGVFLSANNGTTWTAVNTGLTNQFVRSLAVSGTNLFAGTDGGVFLSANNGTSWTEVNTGLTIKFVYSLAGIGSNLFAGTGGGGVFLSTNNGTSWTAVNSGLTSQNVFSLAVSGTNLFAGTIGGGVFLSTNNGTSWTAVNTGLTNLDVYSLAVSGTNLFAGTTGGGVFLSTNNGTSWTAVNSGLTNQNVFSLAVSGTNLFAGTVGGEVFLSANNGTSWTAVNTGLTNQDIRSFAIIGSNLFAGTQGGGVFLSANNGTSWTAVNTGLTAQNVVSLAVSGTNLFAGTYGGVFLSANNGTSWTAVNTGLTNQKVYSLAGTGSNLFAGTYGGGVFLSANNGTSWTAVNIGLTIQYVNALAVSGSNLFAGTNGGVFLSANNGTSWTEVNIGLGTQFVYSLAVIGSNLFAGTIGGVFLSTNNGTSWTAVNSGLTNQNVLSLAVSGTNLFAGTLAGVFLSANNGTSWTAVNTGLMFSLYSLAVSGTNLFAGTAGAGVFLSPNNGTSWTAVNTGLTNQDMRSFAVSGTNLFAGTNGSGTWSRPLSEFADTTSPLEVSNSTLDKIAPNTAIPVSANFTDIGSGIVSAKIQYRPIAGALPNNFIEATLTNSSGSTYTGTIPGGAVTELGVEYKYLVTDGSGLTNSAILYKTRILHAQGNAQTLSIPYTDPGREVTNYRIIAIPLDLDSKSVDGVFNNTFGGYDNTQYTMYRWEGGPDYAALNANSQLELGKGYWYLTPISTPVYVGPGTTPDVTTSSPFQITLAPGWNQIGNPYNFDISWADILTANPTKVANLGNNSKIRVYRGTVSDVDELLKFEGGFVKNTSTSSLIIDIPVAKNLSINGRKSQSSPIKNSLDQREWEIRFDLKEGSTEYKLGGLGMHPEADFDFDFHDDFNLPRFVDYLEVKFPKQRVGMTYTKDIVPTTENFIWDFTIESNLKEEQISIGWDNSYFGNTKEVYLLDVATHRITDMRFQDHYNFSHSPSKEFKVVYGTLDFVKKELVPSRIVLHEPYPNPFNDRVEIEYALPKESVTLTAEIGIYNSLGAKVSSINTPGKEGLGKWIWDAAEHASGLYFVRLKLGEQVVTKKLVKR